MSIIKYIYTIVVLFILLQSPFVRAEGQDMSPPAAPSPQQESQPLQERPSETVVQSAPSPIVDNIGSSPSNTILNTETESKEADTRDRLPYLDILHHDISQRLLATAVWLDSFFEDERVEKETNQSYIRVRYDVFQEESAEITVRPTIGVRLALPELEKKAHLIITADEPDSTANTPAPAGITGERIGKTDDRNVTTAVHYIFRDTEEQNFIMRTGAQFSDGSPVLFIAPRYRYFVPFTTWGFRFTQEAVWKTDTKWQVDTLFDLERQLPRGVFFRSSLGGTWLDGTNGYFYSLSFSLRQPFGPQHALDYSWVNSYQTRPVYELTEILLSVRYRQKIWRDWLFYEVAPQLRFSRTEHFKGIPGVLFRFEMFFGKKV